MTDNGTLKSQLITFGMKEDLLSKKTLTSNEQRFYLHKLLNYMQNTFKKKVFLVC